MSLTLDGLGDSTALNPLLKHANGGSSADEPEIALVKGKERNACRYATGTTVLASGGALTFIRYYNEWSNPVAITFTAVALGASTQAGTDIILPRRLAQKVHRFQEHYLTPELLGLWQLYVNFPDVPWVKELALGTLCVIGGSYFVIKISSVALKRMSDLQSDRKKYGAKERLNVALEPQTRCQKRCWEIFKTAVGIGGMAASVWIKGWATTLLNVGGYFVGHAVGVTAQEFFSAQQKKLEDGLAAARESDPATPIPGSLRAARIAGKAARIFGKNGWGMLVVANHPAAYTAIGALIGAGKSSELQQFQRMTSIQPEEELSPGMKNAARVFNTTLLVGAHVYTIYAIVTANEVIDKVVLAAFAGGGYLGYVTTRYLNLNFDPATSGTLTNTLQFYTDEHADPLAIFYLYIREQMEMGDVELVNYDMAGKVLLALAYASLGVAVGNDQASPYERDRFAAIADAFVGRLIVRRAYGELD